MSLNELNMYAYDDNETAVYKRVMIGNVAAEGDVAGIALGGTTDGDVSMTSTDNVIRITPQTGVKIFSNSTQFSQMDSNGFKVFRGSASQPVAIFGTDATVGRSDGTNSNVFIDSSEGTVAVRKGTQVSASFGATTTIGPTSGRHVKITGTALEIKTGANNTVLSASAAGLEMSGSIIASSGRISNFSITSGSIESSANAKRGLKLEPGDSIRGYGNAVHSTETTQGKFSFVEGATISPPAGTTVRWSTDLSVAAAPVERSTN